MLRFLDAGRDMLASLQYAARCTCGYCHISDVEFHQQEDHMESFFLAETVSHPGFPSKCHVTIFPRKFD